MLALSVLAVVSSSVGFSRTVVAPIDATRRAPVCILSMEVFSSLPAAGSRFPCHLASAVLGYLAFHGTYSGRNGAQGACRSISRGVSTQVAGCCPARLPLGPAGTGTPTAIYVLFSGVPVAAWTRRP